MSMVSYQRVNAGDRDSFEAVRIFNEKYADIPWKKALVTRFDGMTLFEAANGEIGPLRAVRFQCCACGFDGHGPQCTRDILVAAGFGDRATLWDAIRRQDRIDLTK